MEYGNTKYFCSSSVFNNSSSAKAMAQTANAMINYFDNCFTQNENRQ